MMENIIIEKEAISEQMRKDVVLSLDISLTKLMKIIEPVNFTWKLSRYKIDRDWIYSGGIPKMLKCLRDVTNAVEYLRDMS